MSGMYKPETAKIPPPTILGAPSSPAVLSRVRVGIAPSATALPNLT
jgi:hypothetical protein